MTSHEYRHVRWEDSYSGNVPSHAVQGGDDGGEPIYVGRAYNDGDMIPGKVHPSHGVCYVPYGGEERSHSSYQVLVNEHHCSLEWQWAGQGNIPNGAIQGGVTSDGEPLYIGRHEHDGTMCLGKIHPSHGCLYLPYGGEEHSKHDYEILVCRTLNLHH